MGGIENAAGVFRRIQPSSHSQKTIRFWQATAKQVDRHSASDLLFQRHDEESVPQAIGVDADMLSIMLPQVCCIDVDVASFVWRLHRLVRHYSFHVMLHRMIRCQRQAPKHLGACELSLPGLV
jgi:hypothetical protein